MIKTWIEEKKKWIVKKLYAKGIISKSVYLDLAPTDSISNEKECLKALDWAISNDRIKNVALTGPYGSGKSSIIESYLKQHSKSKAINISLATFDGRTLEKAKSVYKKDSAEYIKIQNEFEDELEKGILKQLFYKVNADRIPLSRYRKLHHKKLRKYILGILFLLGAILAGSYVIFPDEVKSLLVSYREGITSKRQVYLLCASFVIVLFGLSYILRYVTSKFIIKEVSVGDVSAQGDENLSDESVLNRNIDEMLYFFERTKYKIVFIEDLDRFNSTTIFVKLREINNLLNNYEVIKRKITFVYAVKDDLFQKENERTKFFDFLIPVIPVINSTNSGEIMRDLLGLGNRKYFYKEYPKHNISTKFITLVSPYIADMRVLINIINEFWIYKRTLKDSQEVDLQDEKMLALIIYKNLNPRDFALLEDEKGNVKEAFRYKVKALDNIEQKLETRKEELKLLERDAADSVNDVKRLILSELIESKGAFTSLKISNKSYTYSQILSDDFEFDLLRDNQFEINRKRVGYTIDEFVGSIQNFENSTNRIKDLFKRYDRFCKFYNKSIEKEKTDNELIDKEIMELRACTMQQLIELNSAEEVLPGKVLNNNLLVFMLRHGYIDENYASYINYFHEGSISKEELNFILSIRDYKGENDFGLKITHCANVVDRLYDYEFLQLEALNFDLLDYFIESDISDSKGQCLFKQLANGSSTSLCFIKAYIDRGVNTGIFLRMLCHKSNMVWAQFATDDTISEEKRKKYFKLIIKECINNDIVQNNISIEDEDEGIIYEQPIKEYFESEPSILIDTTDVPWGKIKELIFELDIHFNNLKLKGLPQNIIDDIVIERFFVINCTMFESLCDALDPDGKGKLFKCNYQWLSELNNIPLLEYIHENIEEYVQNIIINVATNTEESLTAIDDLLRRLFKKNEQLCTNVIERQRYAYWNNLSDCLIPYEDDKKQEVWECILENGKTDATWDNYLKYYGTFGLSDVLIRFFDKNIDMFLNGGVNEDVTDEIISELLVEGLTKESFEKLISVYKLNDFTCQINEFSDEKLEIMIHCNYFSFTTERFVELKKISPSLCLEFIRENPVEFMNNVKTLKLNIEDIKKIINNKILEEKDSALLIEELKLEDMDEELAMLLTEFKLVLPKKYVEVIWKLLDKNGKLKLLFNQMECYDLDEVAEKMGQLGEEYEQFTNRDRHKYQLHFTEINLLLCQKLKEKGFLSSCEVTEEKVGGALIPLMGRTEKVITGNVKKKTENNV